MPELILKRGDTWEQPLTGLGDLTGRTKLWFTAKRSPAHADVDAVIQIEESVGLIRLNGAAAISGDGDIDVTDEAGGSVTVILAAAAAKELGAVGKLFWDVQSAVGATILTRQSGRVLVTLDTTRDIL